MGYYVTENIDVDVRVDGADIASAIESKKLTQEEVKMIIESGNRFLSGQGVMIVSDISYWDVQWVKLLKTLKEKFPNPDEFEEFLNNNKVLEF
ncbi:MAG: hypothetical protein P8J32_09065 [bacterium]|nr:hypothetical protein [bacterium]